MEPEDNDHVANAIRSVQAGSGKTRRNLMLTIVRRNGTRSVAEAIFQFARPRELGTATGVQITIRDLSKMQRTEALEDRLRQAQRMESIGRLAGGVAHDFNNILTVILATADLLQRRLPEGSPLSSDVTRILDAGARGAALTRQLLAFSRQQVIARVPLDLGNVVREVVLMLRPLLGEHISIRTEQVKQGLFIEGDRSQLEQVFMNLAVNARDAMPEGGTLHISVSEHVRHLEHGERRCVRVTVRDTGEGMDPETQEHAFEPFFTTKGRDRGTGLGLATVHGIVQQCGGVIEIESEPGQGTAFHLDFPPTTRRPKELPPSASAEQRKVSGTVLLVEDEEAVRTVTRKMLEAEGFDVIVADSAARALQLWKEHGTRIDILLTDVVMPGESGLALVKRLRANRPALRVLLISGYPAGELPGPNEPEVPMLSKPFTIRELREALEQIGAP
jgi:signal transduction histidine kinase/CheY-like chemotaxis protein